MCGIDVYRYNLSFPDLQDFSMIQTRHSLPSGMLEARSSIEIVGELIHEINSLVEMRVRESADAVELEKPSSRW